MPHGTTWKLLRAALRAPRTPLRAWAPTTLGQPPAPASPAPPHLEPLEPRVLLSANLSSADLAVRFTDRAINTPDQPGIVRVLENGAVASPTPSTPVFQPRIDPPRLGNGTRISQPSLKAPATPVSQAIGSDGHDFLVAKQASGQLLGGIGDDTLAVLPDLFDTNQQVRVEAGPGDDLIYAMAGRSHVLGGPGHDVLFLGDAEATYEGVEEVWIRDRVSWTWTPLDTPEAADQSRTVRNIDSSATTTSLQRQSDIQTDVSLDPTFAPLDFSTSAPSTETATNPPPSAPLAMSASAAAPDGLVNRDYWTDLSGWQLTGLTTSALYPSQPTGSDQLTSLQATDWADPAVSANWSNAYGQRITGYLVAPETGQYTFWIAGDDQAEFRLSTDDSTANLAPLASVQTWTHPTAWDKEPNQQSAPVTLQAGQAYALEVLHKEGGGGDHLAVGWRKPSDGSGTAPTEIVPGTALSSVLPTTTPPTDRPGLEVAPGDLEYAGDLNADGWIDQADIDLLLQALDTAADAQPDQSLGNVRNGVRAQDDATGHGYILYSQQAIRARFAATTFHSQHADHFLAVQFLEDPSTGQPRWFFHNDDAALAPFDPDPTDLLVIELDFDNDKAKRLRGQANEYEGIELGFLTGNLTATPNKWWDFDNPGEFRINGTSFQRNPSDMAGAPLAYDLFPDGKLNQNDANHLIHGFLSTNYGDADLNGQIEQADLDAVLTHWGGTTSGWAEGNYNLASPSVAQEDMDLVLTNWGWNANNPVELTGGPGPDIFYGYGHNDTLRGKGGNDFLWGANGADILDGDDGTDYYYDRESIDVIMDPTGFDDDFDGLSNSQEVFIFRSSPITYADSDIDGLPDDWEMAYGFNPTSPTQYTYHNDGDSLDLRQELAAGTSPLLADTDSDGVNDSDEYQLGSDPIDKHQTSLSITGKTQVVNIVVDDSHIPIQDAAAQWSMRVGTNKLTMPSIGTKLTTNLNLASGQSYPLSIRQVDWDEDSNGHHVYAWSNEVSGYQNGFKIIRGAADITGLRSAAGSGVSIDASGNSHARLVLMDFELNASKPYTFVPRHTDQHLVPITIYTSRNIVEAEPTDVKLWLSGSQSRYFLNSNGTNEIISGRDGRFNPRDHGMAFGEAFTIYAQAKHSHTTGRIEANLEISGNAWSGTLTDEIYLPQFDGNIIVSKTHDNRGISTIYFDVEESNEEDISLLVNNDDDDLNGIRDYTFGEIFPAAYIDNDLARVTIPKMINDAPANAGTFQLLATGDIDLYTDPQGNTPAPFIPVLDPTETHYFWVEAKNLGEGTIRINNVTGGNPATSIDFAAFHNVQIDGPILADPIGGAEYTVSNRPPSSSWPGGSILPTEHITWSYDYLDAGYIRFSVSGMDLQYDVDLETINHRLFDYWYPASELGVALDNISEGSSVTFYYDANSESPSFDITLVQDSPPHSLATRYKFVNHSGVLVDEGLSSHEEKVEIHLDELTGEQLYHMYTGFDNVSINNTLDSSEYAYSIDVHLVPWEWDIPNIALLSNNVSPIAGESARSYALRLLNTFKSEYRHDVWYEEFGINNLMDELIDAHSLYTGVVYQWSDDDPNYLPSTETMSFPPTGVSLSTMIHEMWHLWNHQENPNTFGARDDEGVGYLLGGNGGDGLLNGYAARLHRFEEMIDNLQDITSRSQQRIAIQQLADEWSLLGRFFNSNVLGAPGQYQILIVTPRVEFTVNGNDLGHLESAMPSVDVSFVELTDSYNQLIDIFESNREWNLSLNSFAEEASFSETIIDNKARFQLNFTVEVAFEAL